MKKLTALLLCLAMIVACVSALAAEAADVTGMWYMVATQLDGALLTPSQLGMDVTLTLNEDGTGDMTNVGVQTLEGIWKLEDDVVTLMNGETIIARYQLEDETLTIIESPVVMQFARQPVSSGLVRPVAVMAEKAEDFYGVYSLSFIYDDARVVPASVLGMEAVMLITEEGMVSLENGEKVVTPYVFSPSASKLAVTDGTSVMAVQLNEDGSISIQQSGMMSLCLTRME